MLMSMGTKGKKKAAKEGSNPTAKTAQRNALEFDDKYRNTESFKDDLLALRKKFGGDEDLKFRAGNPRYVIGYSEKEYDALLAEMLSVFATMERRARLEFDPNIVAFMRTHSLSREWKPYIVQLILTGAYDVPRYNFWLERNEDFPNNILIGVGAHTTARDIKQALSIAQKELPQAPVRKRFYGKSYSEIEDPEFIDLIKMTESPYIHRSSLPSQLDVILYDGAIAKGKTPQLAAEDIYRSRKMREGTKAVKPTFRTQSDKEYFSLNGLRGKSLAREAERLKKQRHKYKSRSS
jgi:hypothetical protein